MVCGYLKPILDDEWVKLKTAIGMAVELAVEVECGFVVAVLKGGIGVDEGHLPMAVVVVQAAHQSAAVVVQSTVLGGKGKGNFGDVEFIAADVPIFRCGFKVEFEAGYFDVECGVLTCELAGLVLCLALPIEFDALALG